jgi:hypothetical protein
VAERVLAEESVELGKESDDDDVVEKKNEERACADTVKLPKVLFGDSNDKRDSRRF